MSQSPLVTPPACDFTWPGIFELWRDPDKPSEKRLAVRMAADFKLTSYEVTRQWRMRNFVPIWHWPRLIEVLWERFEIAISYRDLVMMSIAMRASGRKDAA